MTLPRTADVVIVGAGIGGLGFARELAARGVKDIVVLERDYPGAGATGRNVARIRRMQLTEELCRVAMALRTSTSGWAASSARTSCSTARLRMDPVRPRRGRPDAGRRGDACATGIRSALLSPQDTLHHLPVFEGGEPVAARCSATMRSSITMRSSGHTSTTWPGVA